MNRDSKIYVAGHRGLVGSAILTKLQECGYQNVVFRTHSELELTDQKAVEAFFELEKPDYVFLAAAKVGGIFANNEYRADFIYQNLQIQNNVIHQSYLSGVKKLLFLGSTCIYPQKAPQPMPEDCLLSSELEYTNEPYAIAKIAGIKMCESYNIQHGTNFISVMPTNLYGIKDNFDLKTSHVIPALMRKMHEAKVQGASEVVVWGSGKPRREFLYNEDMADACVYIMEKVNFSDLAKNKDEVRNTHINIGVGTDVTISDLAAMVKKEVGFEGALRYDTSMPDGTMLKRTDTTKLRNLGWQPNVNLEEGIKRVYQAVFCQ